MSRRAISARYNIDRGAQIIDINMGCPAKKVCNKWAGSALMQDEALALEIIEAVVQAVLDVAEVSARNVEPQRSTQNEADLFDPGGIRRGVDPHALRQVAGADGVVPDAFVSVRVYARAATVEGEGDQRLGDAELFGQMGLRDLSRARHTAEV